MPGFYMLFFASFALSAVENSFLVNDYNKVFRHQSAYLLRRPAFFREPGPCFRMLAAILSRRPALVSA